MTTNIVGSNVSKLLEDWLKAESEGIEFPVIFDIAWQIAGYSRKDSAKRKLMKLSQDKDFHRSVEVRKRPQGGTVEVEIFSLTCDAFKHFCLLSETSEGHNIRQYFIEAEKKWKIVEQFRPEVAQQAEMIKLQTELARYNASFAENQRFIMEKSEAIINLHGPQMLALIQGRPDAVVEKTERVTETVVVKDGRSVSFEGKSLAELAKELGFKTGTQLETWLRKHDAEHLVCQGMRAVQASYIPTENLKAIKELWASRKVGRQMLLGE